MILYCGALILGGLLGAYVYYGHADLLWLPVYILGGAGAVVAVLLVAVVLVLAGQAAVRLARRRVAPVVSVADGAAAYLREVS